MSWPPATRKNGVPVPGGDSNLAHEQFLFSFFTHEQHIYDGRNPGTAPLGEFPKRGVQFLQLDNRGIAAVASSELVGDIVMSRENCLGIPGNIHKMTRITASRGGKQ